MSKKKQIKLNINLFLVLQENQYFLFGQKNVAVNNIFLISINPKLLINAKLYDKHINIGPLIPILFHTISVHEFFIFLFLRSFHTEQF